VAGGRLETDDADHEQAEEDEARGRRRVAVADDPDDGRTDGADPTQTLYAVPSGITRAAAASVSMLAASRLPKTSDGTNRVNPCVAGSADAQPTSSNPATINRIHGTTTSSETVFALPVRSPSSAQARIDFRTDPIQLSAARDRW
jgi:hypothetical protein